MENTIKAEFLRSYLCMTGTTRGHAYDPIVLLNGQFHALNEKTIFQELNHLVLGTHSRECERNSK